MSIRRSSALVLVLAVCCQAVYKRWVPNTNFNNPQNWNAGRAPCGNDIVVIPDESPVVYVQANTTIQELVLPLNGELLLDNNFNLKFTNTPDASGACPDAGGDVEFSVSHPRKWVDPNNWCWTSTQLGACSFPPLLDSEKIPCQYDDAVFPRKQAYYVTFGTNMNLKMKTLRISGTSLTTTTFRNYLQTDDGQRMFPPTQGQTASTVTISRTSCDDRSGCPCGNDQGEILRQICSIQSKRCDRARCRKPLTPMGNCCKLCGAVLNCTAGQGFDISEFQTTLKNSFFNGQNDFRNVKMILSKTSSNIVQLVLTDDRGETSSRVAQFIYGNITQDIQQGGHRFALDNVQVDLSWEPTTTPTTTPTSSSGSGTGSSGTSGTSGTGTGQTSSSGSNPPNPTGSHQPLTSGELGGGAKAGIAFGVIIIVLVILVGALFVFRRRRGETMIPNFTKPDMTRLTQAFRRSGGSRPSATVRPNYGAGGDIEMSGEGFVNPIYGDVGYGGEVRTMELQSTGDLQPTFDNSEGFDNPLYGTSGKMQQSLYSDPTETLDNTVTIGHMSGKTDSTM